MNAMKIEINNHRKIFAIQKEFSGLFPCLKIEFHEKSNKQSGPPSHKLVKSSSKCLSECRTLHNDGTISITPQMSTGDLKQSFRDNFGLTIEVFQKTSNKTWRQIDATENIILDELNKEAAYSTPTI
ncbi:MAG: hypothetical protein K0S53_1897 [Bacteroidetes bacterium]|jgi:hypothetical protein|nr:hypothetical protein [Bacteroidota bacterium]MDF2450921.1 hypothetical protein [Bacteroidota bacterium]